MTAPTTPAQIPELLPCPFCECAAHLIEGHRDHWRAQCTSCGANIGEFFARRDAKQKAASAWNRRATRPIASGDGLREALEWYRDEAQAAQRYMTGTKNGHALTAVLTVLANDGGRRARAALAATPARSQDPDEALIARVERAIDDAAGTCSEDASCWRDHAVAAIRVVQSSAGLAPALAPGAACTSPSAEYDRQATLPVRGDTEALAPGAEEAAHTDTSRYLSAWQEGYDEGTREGTDFHAETFRYLIARLQERDLLSPDAQTEGVTANGAIQALDDHERELLAQIRPAPAETPAAGWRDISTAPDVPQGEERPFILAYRSRYNDKIYVREMHYLNAFPLAIEDADDADEEGMSLRTGWHNVEPHYEYEEWFSPLPGVFLAWMPLPMAPVHGGEDD